MNQIEQMQEWIDHHSGRADRAESINAELLEALSGMLGLVALMVSRSDIPSPAKEAAIDSHRWKAAHAAIAKATGGAK